MRQLILEEHNMFIPSANRQVLQTMPDAPCPLKGEKYFFFPVAAAFDFEGYGGDSRNDDR